MPPGRYTLKMFGEALPGSSVVPVTVMAETVVTTDARGKYSLNIDTSGIPAGEYRIEGAGDAKTILLGGSTSTSTSNDGNGGGSIKGVIENKESESGNANYGSSGSRSSAKPVAINRETVSWYAMQLGLKIENQSRYDDVEKLLRKRLSGGYWKIIARGEPLTEAAGNCQEDYCLVRGIDACTVCRDRDMILSQNESTLENTTERNIRTGGSQATQNTTQIISQPNLDETWQEKGLISRTIDWFAQLLRG